jgi:RNA polymerase sigma-70 factor (ECF subfamily)
LVLRHQHRIYAFALAMTGTPHDAEEVAQESFVRAYRALRGYAPERVRDLKESAWLHRIALNVQRNRVRRRRLPIEPLERALEVAEGAAGPEQLAERRETAAELAAAVACMPPRYRESVVLRHVQGMSYDQAAEVLGRPAGTVKSEVHRGLALLRAGIAKACEDER